MTVEPAIPDSVRPLIARLATAPGVERVISFGSRARGDHRERSNVDLAVDAPGVSRVDWLRLKVDADEARTLFHVELVRLEEAPTRLKASIDRGGIYV